MRYFRETGQMWLVCQSSGFWVLELSPVAKAVLEAPRQAARR